MITQANRSNSCNYFSIFPNSVINNTISKVNSQCNLKKGNSVKFKLVINNKFCINPTENIIEKKNLYSDHIKKNLIKIKVKIVENKQNLFKSDVFSKLGKLQNNERYLQNIKVNKSSKLNEIIEKFSKMMTNSNNLV